MRLGGGRSAAVRAGAARSASETPKRRLAADGLVFKERRLGTANGRSRRYTACAGPSYGRSWPGKLGCSTSSLSLVAGAVPWPRVLPLGFAIRMRALLFGRRLHDGG